MFIFTNDWLTGETGVVSLRNEMPRSRQHKRQIPEGELRGQLLIQLITHAHSNAHDSQLTKLTNCKDRSIN